MPKNNIPTDSGTFAALDAVPADAVFDRLSGLLEAAENAADRVAELKDAGKKRFPKGLRKQALEVPHLRRLSERITAESPEMRQKLSQLFVAASMTAKAEEDAKAARRNRDRALHVLHIRHKVQKVELYTKYDIGRMKLNTAFNTFPGKMPAWSVEKASAIAEAEHAKYAHAISVEKTARQRRNDLFAELERPTVASLNAPDDEGPGYPTSDLARLSGLTDARVTQLRTGSSNAARTRKAAEVRRAKQEAAIRAAAEGEQIGA